MIFLKSLSMVFLPKGSDHFLLALVNAFFLLLYLNEIMWRYLVLGRYWGKEKEWIPHRVASKSTRAENSIHVMVTQLNTLHCTINQFNSEPDWILQFNSLHNSVWALSQWSKSLIGLWLDLFVWQKANNMIKWWRYDYAVIAQLLPVLVKATTAFFG